MPDSTKRILTDETGQDIVSALQSLQNVIDPNGTTVAAAAKIDNMTVAASDLAAGATPTATISEVSGHKHIAFGIPKGNKGDKGDKGDPGDATIDDTAGEGDVDLVWSADKLTAEKKTLDGKKSPAIYEEIESVPLATFADGAEDMPLKDLKVAIEPVQDLHGYDNPWPAGGGMNKLGLVADIDRTVAGVQFTFDASTGTFTVNGTNTNASNHPAYYWGVSDDLRVPNFNAGETYTLFVDNTSLPMYMQFTYRNTFNEVSSLGYCNFSYGRISFVVPDNFGSLVDFQMYIAGSATNMSGSFHVWLVEGNVTTSAYSPYSNICPITGWTGAKVTRTGFNICDEEYELGYYDITTGNKVSSAVNKRIKNFIPCLPSTTYYIKANVRVLYYNMNKAFISTELKNNTTFTTPANAYYLTFFGGIDLSNVCINISDTTKNGTYEPYAGHQYSIAFPAESGTVYGGTLDVISGVLTVDRTEVDLGNLNYTKYDVAQGTLFRGSISGAKTLSGVAVPNMICSMYPVTDSSRRTNKTVSQATGLAAVDVIDNDYSDADTFKTAMSGVQLVYELATPITYTLTTTEVRTLLGLNHIWADTGDINLLTYPVDTAIKVDNVDTRITSVLSAMVAPVLTDMVADTALAVNQFRVVNDTLYKVTAPIASGGILTPGTNVIATSIGEQITALLNA